MRTSVIAGLVPPLPTEEVDPRLAVLVADQEVEVDGLPPVPVRRDGMAADDDEGQASRPCLTDQVLQHARVSVAHGRGAPKGGAPPPLTRGAPTAYGSAGRSGPVREGVRDVTDPLNAP